MTSLVQYRDPTDTSREPSPIIWGRCPWEVIKKLNNGVAYFDDFTNFGLSTAVSSNVGRYFSDHGGYISYEDSGDSIAQLATEIGGVVSLVTDTTDNDEVWMMPGGTASVLLKLTNTSGSEYKTWFECRVRPASITVGNWFVGMSEEGLAAADTITDGGAMASKDFIGFRQLEDAATAMDIVYRKAGQTEQEVLAAAQTLVAATWYKLGFFYDPSADDSKQITFYIDGVPQTSYVTRTNMDAATFPEGEELHFLAGIKNSSAAANTLDIDWVKIAQFHG